MSIPPEFDFYDVVIITSSKVAHAKIAGLKGAVLGRSCSDSGQWFYAVQILDSGDTWAVQAEDVTPTGDRMSREEFYDGTSVNVTVDPETGEGRLN